MGTGFLVVSLAMRDWRLFTPAFFKRETSLVAEQLLGAYLVREIQGKSLVGRIVETEAYLGLRDPSCHSFGGLKTPRSQNLYQPGGYSYVYLTYGMYHCFNVVTRTQKEPEAVLIRAVQPLKGLKEMQKNRNKQTTTELCSGPGKLCQAFGINKKDNAQNLSQPDLTKSALNKKGALFLAQGQAFKDIECDARVGLPWHKDSAYWFLRFYVKNNPYVSLKKNQI